jgi:hypothetical protein
MSVLQDMKSMQARVALVFVLSAGLISVGVGCKSSPPAATPTGVAAGATTNPDGSVTNPDGSVTYPPGSAQAAAAQGIKNADGSVTNGNGSVTYAKGSPQAKSEPGPGGTSPATAVSPETAASGSGAPPVAAAPPEPPPPPAPVVLNVPSGTGVSVSISQQLSASKNSVGDGFSGVLASSIKDANGAVLYPRGTRVQGTVIASKGQGRFKGAGALGIEITSIGGQRVSSSEYEKAQSGKGKRTAGFIGGGAGGGALIGGLAGGGKGALIGGLVGAGAGTAGAAFTGNKDVVIAAETIIKFTLTAPLSVTVQPGAAQEGAPPAGGLQQQPGPPPQ